MKICAKMMIDVAARLPAIVISGVKATGAVGLSAVTSSMLNGASVR
ncbi:MAG: hypothetical protein GDA43_03730 [Hormoscilla sp. SP5CHS1]|nr:hypothetical protein [Hormoscilla sp. SP12CHS1]MBC6452410.1 hypothetical protein [Hormoscilla sp. SP5CHS1]MBC6473652.1 hypothetical protein [Hormoscilla sp. GM102CHS1]